MYLLWADLDHPPNLFNFLISVTPFKILMNNINLPQYIIIKYSKLYFSTQIIKYSTNFIIKYSL